MIRHITNTSTYTTSREDLGLVTAGRSAHTQFYEFKNRFGHQEKIKINPLPNIETLTTQKKLQALSLHLKFSLFYLLSESREGQEFIVHGGVVMGMYLDELITDHCYHNHYDQKLETNIRKNIALFPLKIDDFNDIDLSTCNTSPNDHLIMGYLKRATGGFEDSLEFIESAVVEHSEIYKRDPLDISKRETDDYIITGRSKTLTVMSYNERLLKIDFNYKPKVDIDDNFICSRPYNNEHTNQGLNEYTNENLIFQTGHLHIKRCTIAQLIENLQYAYDNTEGLSSG